MPPPSVVRQHFKISSPLPPWVGENKVCSNGDGHITNMAAMSIYGENLKISSPMTLKLGMQNRALEYYQVCSNDGPGLTLTYFRARSNLVPYAFVWEKGKTMDFSETIVVLVTKLGYIDSYFFWHKLAKLMGRLTLC